MINLYKQNHAKKYVFSGFKWGKFISLSFLLATNLVMYATFLLAYFSESKSVLVSINKVGEANFELWVMGFMTILSIVMVYMMLKEEITNAKAN